MTNPADLIRDRKRTPFNLSYAIDLQDFQLDEAQPLLIGFQDQASNPEAILKTILSWTGGNRYLLKKLAKR